MTDETDRESRDHLFALGWHEAGVEISTYGITLLLRERPYTSDVPGIRTLRIFGQDREDAARRFVDQAVEVHVVAGAFTTFGNTCPSDDTVHHILVEPVAPLPGEVGDQWIITRIGPAAAPFANAANTEQTFVIMRREARLANADEFGRRTPPLPGDPASR